MKPTIEAQTEGKPKTAPIYSSAFKREVLKQVHKARARICSEYRGLIEGVENGCRLALNEAEALAWETGFPQLVFPDLAAEKVAALAQWRQRQDAVQGLRPALASFV